MKTVSRNAVSDQYLARLHLGDKANHPVEIVPGKAEPHWEGKAAYYTTPAGTPIYYPNAYRWPKIRYGSTLHIEVGRQWLASHKLRQRVTLAGVPMVLLPRHAETLHGVRAVPGYYTAIYGRGWLVTRGKLSYHVYGGSAREAIAKAVKAWRKQREADALDAAVDAGRVWVQISDSLAAGNCVPATEQFAQTLRERLHLGDAEIGAVRADLILSVRDDQYTRRAVRMAARRTLGV